MVSPVLKSSCCRRVVQVTLCAIFVFALSPGCERQAEEPAASKTKAIGVTLLTMPEGSAFRGWYPEAGRTSLEAYLTGLSRVYAIAWVDARTWVADDRFSDGHHLLAGGATVFTKRFGREVLDTLVERHLRPR